MPNARPNFPFVRNQNNIYVPVLPNLGLELPFIPGNIWHVRPRYGHDLNNNGLRPDSAFKTPEKAFDKMVADQNDVLLLYSESNSASLTTSLLSTTLTWSKNLCHLIGVGSANPFSSRARVAWASAAASDSDIPLINVTGSGCLFRNVSFVVGSSDANLSFGLAVSGDRNRFERISVANPTNAANDVAGAYSLYLNGCTDSIFEDCNFGSYTIDMGSAANSVLLVAGGGSLTKFRRCLFINRIEHGTNSPLVSIPAATGVGFGCLFFEDRCGFISTSVNGAYSQTGAFKVGAAQNDGKVIIDPTCYTNATKWDSQDANQILIAGPATPAADTVNVMLAV